MTDGSSVWAQHVALSGLSPADLWLAFVAMGGMATPSQLDDIVDGRSVAAVGEHNVLAHALNERISDLGKNSPVPYYD